MEATKESQASHYGKEAAKCESTQELDVMILMDLFQLRVFDDSAPHTNCPGSWFNVNLFHAQAVQVPSADGGSVCPYGLSHIVI